MRLSLSRDTIKKGLAVISAGDLTRSWTQDFCNPMPITPKDYLTFGMISFGLCAVSLRSLPLFMPIVWSLDKIDKNINEIIERKRAYVKGAK